MECRLRWGAGLVSLKFESHVAGRFHAEFFFYILLFAGSLYFAAQHHSNPWLALLVILSAVLLLEMTYLLFQNIRRAGKDSVVLDSARITVSDNEGIERIAWKDVERVQIAWFSRDRWLEVFFGLDPSILVKRRNTPSGVFEFGISPDFFKTQKILFEMQRLHKDKIYIT